MGGFPSGQVHCHRCELPLVRPLLVGVGQGSRREVKGERIGLVLIPTLISAVFGQGLCFLFVEEVVDHGQFGTCQDANIGMIPKAPPAGK